MSRTDAAPVPPEPAIVAVGNWEFYTVARRASPSHLRVHERWTFVSEHNVHFEAAEPDAKRRDVCY